MMGDDISLLRAGQCYGEINPQPDAVEGDAWAEKFTKGIEDNTVSGAILHHATTNLTIFFVTKQNRVVISTDASEVDTYNLT
jgi:hypothetical protein